MVIGFFYHEKIKYIPYLLFNQKSNELLIKKRVKRNVDLKIKSNESDEDNKLKEHR